MPEAHDEVYATQDGWNALPAKWKGDAYRYSVRQTPAGKRYFTEVVMPLPGVKLADLQARLTDAWTWWAHGKFKISEKRADGSMDYTFWPSPTPVVKLVCSMAPPQLLPDGGVRLLSSMSGTADGAYYFDLKSVEGGVVLTSRQLGVPRGLIPTLMGMDTFAKTHIMSEIGEFGFPLPKGSGFVALRQALGVA